ncbi:MAG: hypothetical protein JKY84_11200 [Emcibacteraceae bacterium]|nr:hypothetical protein [Emcibacteraceae bacterium]
MLDVVSWLMRDEKLNKVIGRIGVFVLQISRPYISRIKDGKNICEPLRCKAKIDGLNVIEL